MHVGIVGAGPAGLLAAGTLQRAGVDVTVFDKGRRPGGRLNTREHGDHRFDHGAQFFTVRDERIRPMLDEWLEAGVVREWSGRLVRLDADRQEPAKEAHRYVGSPGMISLAAHLAIGVDVRAGIRVETLARDGGSWLLGDDRGEHVGRFDRVIVAVPAPQAVPLLSEVPELARVAAGVEMAPCWAAMLVFADRPPMDFDGAFVADGPVSWIARDGSKPGRPDAESWVVHAAPGWTRTHWDVDRSEIPGVLRGLLAERFGPVPATTFERAHRWGFALASEPAPGVWFDRVAGVGIAGDWCVGGRVEGALTSGLDVAEQLLAG